MELGLRLCEEMAQDAKTNTGSVDEARHKSCAISAVEDEYQEKRRPKQPHQCTARGRDVLEDEPEE